MNRGKFLTTLQIVAFLLSILLGLHFGTQQVAYAIGMEGALGGKGFAPWNILLWSREFGNIYRDELNGGLNIVLLWMGLGAVLVIILNFFKDSETKKAVTHGSADWAKDKDISQASLHSSRGVVLGRSNSGKTLRDDSDQHVLLCAPTRTGKGVGLIVPTLFEWPESVIVTDIKGENWQKTSAHRAKFSNVIYFNPRDPKTARFNPLLEIRPGLEEMADVQTLVETLTDPKGTEKDDHWLKSSRTFLQGVVLHVLYAEADKSLGGVARFLFDPGRSAEDMLQRMLTAPHYSSGKGHSLVTSVARSMLDKSENERSGVISTARECLSLYREPLLSEALSESDFRLSQIIDGDHPLSLYLVVSPNDLSRLSPIIRIILTQFVQRLCEKYSPNERRYKLLMLLDEFPALGKLHFFEDQLAYVAGYGMKIFCVVQSMNQLAQIYGKEHTILDNMNTRVFFTPNTLETAESVSRMLGSKTEIHYSRSNSGQKNQLSLHNLSLSEHRHSRSLLTADEILRFDKEKEIILVANTKPIEAKKIRYFEDREFRVFTEGDAALSSSRPYPYRPKKISCEWETLAPVTFGDDFDDYDPALSSQDDEGDFFLLDQIKEEASEHLKTGTED